MVGILEKRGKGRKLPLNRFIFDPKGVGVTITEIREEDAGIDILRCEVRGEMARGKSMLSLRHTSR